MQTRQQLIKSSFALVAPQADAFVERFYDNLFADYPAVKPLFEQSEMKQQRKKLLAALKLVVASAGDIGLLEAALQEMGQRHVGYGAQPDHYPAVGATLLKTLSQVAGAAWTPELETAWSEVVNEVAQRMIEGAAELVSH